MTTVHAPVVALADARDLALAGGKAVNLAAMIEAGFAVPDGFVVPTPAYAEAATAAGLDGVLADPGDDLPARARAALLAVPVPAGVAAAVTAAYLALGRDVAVAVRSSATAEDLPGASFAGQQDTYLNVVGAGNVVDAVRRCWASLWTDRAVAYRSDAGIGHAELAVVVQRMVAAEAAGVLFTADPVSGRRTRSVVDAAPGLGDAVVSGSVDPDHWAVDRAIEGPPDGCLTATQLRELVALGRRVEAHFGAPQDIEFAFDGEGALWLTQSRAITTLYPVPPSRGPGLRVHLNASLAQGLTRPVTPMGLSAFRIVTSTVAREVFGMSVPDVLAGPPAFGVAGGRAFADATPLLRSRVGRALAPRVLDVMEARSAVVFRSLLDEPALAVTTTSVLPFVRRIARVAFRFRIPPLILLALVRPAAARRHVDRIGAEVRATPTPQDLDAVIALLARVMPIMPRVVPVAGAGFLALALARRAAGPDLDAAAVHAVLRSVPHNVTTDMDLELWERATRLDDAAAVALRDLPPAELAARHHAGTLPPVLARELAGFLAEHGHRAPAEIDLGMPRWRDDPTQVLGSLANYRRITDPAEHPDVRFARGADAAEAAVAGVVARVRGRSRVRAAVTRFALRRTRELVGMRETHKDYLVRLLALARTGLAGLGAELAGRGLLDAADDVFFLELREIRTGADQRVTVAARREEYARELRRRHIPRVLLSDGTEPEALAAPPPDGALVGTAASAGVVTGPVRVVLDPADAHLEPGDILVVPSTDPGWTPLFLTAGGLVMEMGGANSHGAVVAREYGIPAVVGVPDATTRLHTGEIVTVDGAAGSGQWGKIGWVTTFLDDAVGAWLQLPGSATAELVASAGFDFVCVDQQHGFVGDDALLPMLQAVAAAGVPALARPAANAPEPIGRALDRGADGVIVPLVDSASDAAAAVAACHHPPRGSRSYGPVRQGWRGERPAPLCVVMIETTGGVAALPDILGVEGVDGIFVGPSDLALAHGMPTAAQNGDAAYDDLLQAIVGPTRERGLPVGIYTASAAHARRFRQLGFTFTAGPSEATLLHRAAVQHAKEAR